MDVQMLRDHSWRFGDIPNALQNRFCNANVWLNAVFAWSSFFCFECCVRSTIFTFVVAAICSGETHVVLANRATISNLYCRHFISMCMCCACLARSKITYLYFLRQCCVIIIFEPQRVSFFEISRDAKDVFSLTGAAIWVNGLRSNAQGSQMAQHQHVASENRAAGAGLRCNMFSRWKRETICGEKSFLCGVFVANSGPNR